MASRIVSDLVTRSVESALDTAARVRSQLKGASRLFNRVVAKTGLPIPPIPDGGRKTWPGEAAPPQKAPPAPAAPAPARGAATAAADMNTEAAPRVVPAPAPRLPTSEPAPSSAPRTGGLMVETAGPSLEEWRRAREAAKAVVDSQDH